jgi:UDP-N-acetylmuramate--alanine ligase
VTRASSSTYAFITGGGTGGHVYPALAIADALVARGHAAESLLFIGAARGLEATVVPAAGYRIELLAGRGLQRNWRAVIRNFGALVDAARGLLRVTRLMGTERPRVVVGVGGYASVPTVIAARLRRVPVVVHEQNAAPGLANRLAVRLGARAVVSLPDTPLRGAELTGNPLRPEIVATEWKPATAPPQVAFVGGSLGATRINDAALGVYVDWRDRTDVKVRHVTGARNFDACDAALESRRAPGDRLQYELVAYEQDMPGLYAAASAVVARAGAVTVAELAMVGVPSILVPLPNAPGDHQTRNADALVAAGAAIMVADADATPARIEHELDLRQVRRIHIVGVGGAGMSAIAIVLAGMGHHVSGSDIKDSRVLDRLRLFNVDTRVGQSAENVTADLDAVVISTAVPMTNVEVRAALALGVPVLRRAAALGALTEMRPSIAVAGRHGKTTTSSMLTLMLRAADWRPSFVIGGEVNEVGTNALFDSGDWMVVEADESDGTFLELECSAAILTNVEPDHLDYYGGFDALVAAFALFLDGVRGPRVVCADDPVAAELGMAHVPMVSYGFAPEADYRITDYVAAHLGSTFTVSRRGEPLGSIQLPTPGRHNASNAVGALAMALELGVPFDAAARALGGFGGVARRFQLRGERDGVVYVDDYAHLPTEVGAAIGAAREAGFGRVVAVFQPHRYSRTASLWPEFADAFVGADRLVLTDVYAAGEAPRPGVSGHLLVRAVLDAHPDADVAYLPRRIDLETLVPRMTRPGDVVLTLGAGDVTTLADTWLGSAVSP